MIKGRGQGRGRFFSNIEDQVVLLLVYKKESQKAPKRLIDLAKARRDEYLKENR
jgi:phage-related protein